MVNALRSRDRRTSLDDLSPHLDSDSTAAVKAVKRETAKSRSWEPDASINAFTDDLLRHMALETKITASTVDGVTRKVPPAPSLRGPSNDDVLYVGTNPDSVGGESKVLRGALGSKHVQSIDATVKATIVTSPDGRTYDLASPDGRKQFVESLGITGERADKIAALLAPKETIWGTTNTTELQALAQIAIVWSKAERGEAIPSRLLLSGHSGDGTSIGGLSMQAGLRALAQLLPSAANQIEDVCFSACSSVSNAADDAVWVKTFPNLKTMWSYNGKAPSPGSIHFGSWLMVTAGRKDKISLSPDLLKSDVAVWSKKGGYQDRSESLANLLARAKQADTRFDSFVEGVNIPSEHSQPADEDYRTYRKLSTNRNLTPAARLEYANKADQLLRIRFYPKVREVFAKTYEAQIRTAFTMAKMTPVPDFATLPRAEAKAKIEELIRRLGAANVPIEIHQFKSLDKALVKEEWFLR